MHLVASLICTSPEGQSSLNYSSFHSLDSYLGLKMAELKMAEVDSFPEVAASEESMSHMSRCAGVGGAQALKMRS